MNSEEILDNSSKQLERVLGFFTRVETKAAALFAVDLGMIGFMASQLNVADLGYVYTLLTGATTFGLLGLSVWYIYWTFYPDLHQGVSTSSVYFGYIAKLTRENFIGKMLSLSREEYALDVLDQVWRNADILDKKFRYVKRAFLFSSLALPFWFEFLATLALLHSHMTI